MADTFHAQLVISGVDRASAVLQRITRATQTVSGGMVKLASSLEGVKRSSLKATASLFHLERQSRTFRRLGRDLFTKMETSLVGIPAKAGAALSSLISLRVFGVVALTAAMYKFIALGSSYEDSLADIRSITGLTTQSMVQLESQVERLSLTYGSNKNAITKVLQDVASKKSEYLKNIGALTQMTEAVLLLTKASAGLDEQGAVDAITNSLNQFGLGAEHAMRVVHSLAAGTIVGAALVPQMGDALVEVGSVAHDLGMSFEETNAALQILSTRSIVGSRAGRMLRNVLLNMQMAGLDVKKMGLLNVLKALNTVQLSQTEKAALFSKESVVAGNALIELTDVYEKWVGEVTGTTAALKQAEIRMMTTSQKTKRLWMFLENDLTKAWQKMTQKGIDPALTKLVEWQFEQYQTGAGAERLSNILSWLAASLAVLAGVGLTLLIIKLGALAIAGVTAGIGLLAAMGPIGWITIGIFAIIAAIKIFWDKLAPLGSFLKDVFLKVGASLLDNLLLPFREFYNLLRKIPGVADKLPEWKSFGSMLDGKKTALPSESERGSLNQTMKSTVDSAIQEVAVKTNQRLEVDMKIDGPASIKEVRSDRGLDFNADLGMIPVGAY